MSWLAWNGEHFGVGNHGLNHGPGRILNTLVVQTQHTVGPLSTGV